MSTHVPPTFEDAAGRYRQLFALCSVRTVLDEHMEPDKKGQLELNRQIEKICARITAAETREKCESLVMRFPNQIPWFIPALLQYREADLDFGCHLHNGDSLKRRTVNEPAGRPAGGQPPFTWGESAWDALRYDGFHRVPADQWQDVAGILYNIERFNGWGYAYRKLPSPYLWAGSNHYHGGKFVADGLYDANAWDKQLGCALLLKVLCTTGEIALQAAPVAHPAR